MNNAQGIDISQWDVAPLQYDLYAPNRDFIMVKVSEGTEEDPLFRRQWAAGKSKGRRVPYHFWRSFVNGKLAVAKFLNLLGSDAGELPAMLDLEAADGSTEVMALTHGWVDEYQRLTGLWPILYSSKGFLHANGADYQTMWDRFYGRYHNGWLTKCPLMLAEWPFDEIKSMPGYPQLGNELRAVLIQEVIDGKRLLPWPKAPAPWTQVEYWQWTSRYPPGQVPGYFMGPNHKLAVDAIFHRLSREAYEAAHPLPGGAEPPIEPPIEPPAPLQSIKVCVRADRAELIAVQADGQDVTQISTLEVEPFPAPPPVEPPAVVNDVQYGILRFQSIENALTLAGRFTPAVVQIQDHPMPDGRKGRQIPVLPSAWLHIARINDDKGEAYARSVHKMWINKDYVQGETPLAESIGCQFNFVSWTKEENGCAGLRCFQHDDDLSKLDPAQVNWQTRPDVFWKAVAIDIQGDRINVGADIDCFIPLMARGKSAKDGTGELWLALEEIEPFPALPADVIVLPDQAGNPDSHLTIRESYGLDSKPIGVYAAGGQVTLYEYRPLGASVWARTKDGWICLLLAEHAGQHQFLTSWKLETPGVIPPG